MIQIIKEFFTSIILLTLSLFITASNFDATELETIGYYSALLLIYLTYNQILNKINFIDVLEAQSQSVTRHFILMILLLLILKITASNFDETELNTIILFSIFTLLQGLFFRKHIAIKFKGVHVS